MSALQIDVWSDVVCPWCYIGKRRMEAALAEVAPAGGVELRWHSFQLDPTTPKGAGRPVAEGLAEKFNAPPERIAEMTAQVTAVAAEDGLSYALDKAVAANTVDAHRVAHLAADHGLGDAMHERLLKAHLCDGAAVDDPDTLVRLAVETGVPEADARRVVDGAEYAEAVRADIAQARQLGISGVPFFVIDRAYGVSGAQPVEAFRSAFDQVLKAR